MFSSKFKLELTFDLVTLLVVLARISCRVNVYSIVTLAVNSECKDTQVYAILFLLYNVRYRVIKLIEASEHICKACLVISGQAGEGR